MSILEMWRDQRARIHIALSCQNLLISRSGYFTSLTGITGDGKCKKCGRKMPNIIGYCWKNDLKLWNMK